MKKFLYIILTLLIFQLSAISIEDNNKIKSVAILTDHILDPPIVYYNYPASSELFANAVSNELRLRHKLFVKNSAEVRETLKNSTLLPQIKDFETQYRINYNVDFEKLRAFAKVLKTDAILLITSSVDVQNYIMKGTIWNLLNVPGADVVNPVHQIITNVMLVDVNSETIVWQHLYRKNLKARDNGMISVSFPPNNAHLKAVQDYSKAISHQISNAVEEKMCAHSSKNSNSVIGKTKYYSKSVYDEYVGIDFTSKSAEKEVQGYENVTQEYQNQQNPAEKNEQKSKEEKDFFNFFGEKENTQQEENIADEEKSIHQEQNDNKVFEIPAYNPKKEYWKNDNIQIVPSWTPNAYGNKMEEL